MRSLLLIFVFSLFVNGISAQTKIKEEKTYALLDLGFNAKLLNLASDNPQLSKKTEEVVRKSPRSLSDILNKVDENVEEVVQYHLIAGCFSKIENAKSLVSQLQKEGFNSAIVDESNDLYFVAFESYDSHQEALLNLNLFQQQGRETWVSKK